jgi:hypothetical protein
LQARPETIHSQRNPTTITETLKMKIAMINYSKRYCSWR